jgi:hypothetical protein
MDLTGEHHGPTSRVNLRCEHAVVIPGERQSLVPLEICGRAHVATSRCRLRHQSLWGAVPIAIKWDVPPDLRERCGSGVTVTCPPATAAGSRVLGGRRDSPLAVAIVDEPMAGCDSGSLVSPTRTVTFSGARPSASAATCCVHRSRCIARAARAPASRHKHEGSRCFASASESQPDRGSGARSGRVATVRRTRRRTAPSVTEQPRRPPSPHCSLRTKAAAPAAAPMRPRARRGRARNPGVPPSTGG